MKKLLFFMLFGSCVLSAAERLSLDQALSLGLAENPGLRRSRQEIRAAVGRRWSGTSLPRPELSWSYEYMPLGKSLSSFGERTIEVAQELDFPTNYLLRHRLLQADVEAARQQYRKTAITLAAEIKRSYWTARAAGDQLAVARENLALTEEFDRKAAVRYQAGEGSWLEKLTAGMQRTQAVNSLESAQNQAGATLTALGLLVGRRSDPAAPWQLSDSLFYRPQPVDLTALEAQARAQNPDLRGAELARQALSRKRELAWSSLLPGLRFAWSRQAMDGGGSDYWGVTLGASVPLWFLFDQRGQIEEAAADVMAGEYEWIGQANALHAALAEAFLDYTTRERQLLLHLKELLPQAAEIYRTAAVSYDAGEIGYLEFLQSKQTMTAVHAGYIDALLAWQLAAIRLEELTGQLPELPAHDPDLEELNR